LKGNHEGCPYKVPRKPESHDENMKLKLNGTDTEIQDRLTVSGLLETLKIEPARVAVEVNLQIVKKCNFQDHVLRDGDSVEVVNFVGGG
jgi:sulfur carrier protein